MLKYCYFLRWVVGTAVRWQGARSAWFEGVKRTIAGEGCLGMGQGKIGGF